MMWRVIRHRSARRDILEAFVYIGEHNLDAAKRFLQAIQQDILRLRDFPGLGAERSFENPKLIGIHPIPITGFRNYLLFYREGDEKIELLRVLHGARNIKQLMDDHSSAMTTNAPENPYCRGNTGLFCVEKVAAQAKQW